MTDVGRKTPRRSAERARLEGAREWDSPWRKSGPYLSERQWGTVREDSGTALTCVMVRPGGYFQSQVGLTGRGELTS